MEFANRMQLTKRLYTRQNPFVIQITGNQELSNDLDGTLKIYGDYVHIIGIKQNKKKPTLKGTFKFIGPSARHLTIQNLDMKGGIGCKFQQATVTMINVNVQNSAEHGVKVENGDITLKRCIFSGNGHWGLDVQGSVLASDCRFEGNSWGGVRLKSLNLNREPTFSEFKNCIFKNNTFQAVEGATMLKYGLRVQSDVYLWQCDLDKIHADVYRSWTKELSTTIFQYDSTIQKAVLRNDSLIQECSETEYRVRVQTKTTETKTTETKTTNTKETKLRL